MSEDEAARALEVQMALEATGQFDLFTHPHETARAMIAGKWTAAGPVTFDVDRLSDGSMLTGSHYYGRHRADD